MEFVSNTLKMELSEEKTYITHSSNRARFLGYDLSVRRNSEIKPRGRYTSRTLNNKIQLTIPLQEKIEKFMFNNGVVSVKNDELSPCKRNVLLSLTDLEIVSSYNAELRGICNYYNLASNFNKLSYFSYCMEYSCLKTLSGKHRTTIRKVIQKYKDGTGRWCIPYENKMGKRRLYFASYTGCKKNICTSDEICKKTLFHLRSTTTFEKRLKANMCELCGSPDSNNYEVHHINKVKNLKGKELWEQIMIAKRRKTIIVCDECHKKIHSNKF